MAGVVESAVIGLPARRFRRVRDGDRGAGKGGRDRRGFYPRGADGPPGEIQMAETMVFVDDLPRNAMGKVQKNVLRQQYGK